MLEDSLPKRNLPLVMRRRHASWRNWKKFVVVGLVCSVQHVRVQVVFRIVLRSRMKLNVNRIHLRHRLDQDPHTRMIVVYCRHAHYGKSAREGLNRQLHYVGELKKAFEKPDVINRVLFLEEDEADPLHLTVAARDIVLVLLLEGDEAGPLRNMVPRHATVHAHIRAADVEANHARRPGIDADALDAENAHFRARAHLLTRAHLPAPLTVHVHPPRQLDAPGSEVVRARDLTGEIPHRLVANGTGLALDPGLDLGAHDRVPLMTDVNGKCRRND